MTKRVVWSRAALRDYERIIDFIVDRDGIEFANRLHHKLFPAVKGLVAKPDRCRIVPELRRIGVTSYRELIVKPYRVPFRTHGRDVAILGVLDGRRDLEEILLERLTD